jgi:hypothetical protein
MFGKSDPYCVVYFQAHPKKEPRKVHSTSVVEKELNPEWEVSATAARDSEPAVIAHPTTTHSKPQSAFAKQILTRKKVMNANSFFSQPPSSPLLFHGALFWPQSEFVSVLMPANPKQAVVRIEVWDKDESTYLSRASGNFDSDLCYPC